jgi:hypothetical protein
LTTEYLTRGKILPRCYARVYYLMRCRGRGQDQIGEKDMNTLAFIVYGILFAATTVLPVAAGLLGLASGGNREGKQ